MNKTTTTLKETIEQKRLDIFGNQYDTPENAREKFFNARLEAIINYVDDLAMQILDWISDNKKKPKEK